MWPDTVPGSVAEPTEVPAACRPYYVQNAAGRWVLDDLLGHIKSVQTPQELVPVYQIRQYSHRRAAFLRRLPNLQLPVAWFLLAQAPLWIFLAYRRAFVLLRAVSPQAHHPAARALLDGGPFRAPLGPCQRSPPSPHLPVRRRPCHRHCGVSP